MIKLILALPLVVSTLAGLTYLLREKNGNDIRVIWYLFSLTAMVTIVIAAIAIGIGGIKEGEFSGEYGVLLNKLLGLMLDLEKDFIIVTTISSLIILPQIGCYILSGLSGNAKSPILINTSFSFLVWGIIKSLIVGSSIIVTIGFLCIFGYLNEPLGSVLFFLGTGLYFLVLAFGVLSVYREGEVFAHFLGKHVPWLGRIHGCFTRNEKKSDHEEVSDADLQELSKSIIETIYNVNKLAKNYNIQITRKR